MGGGARAAAVAAALLVLFLSPACSPATLPPPQPAPVQDAWRGCVAAGAFDRQDGVPPDGGGVPDDFVATSVVLCQDTSGVGGRAGVERTSSDVAPLLAYLARPSEEPSDGPCLTDGWVRPWLFLLDAGGRYLVPAIPVDGCGKPLGWYDRDSTPLAWNVPTYTERVVRTR